MVYKDGHRGLNMIIASAFGIAGLRLGFSEVVIGIGAGLVVAAARAPDFDAHFDPDLDYFYSNRLLEAVPIHHRGRFHSIGFALAGGMVVSGVGYAGSSLITTEIGPDLTVLAGVAGVGWGVGVCGHLLGDLITRQPIPVFWPFFRDSYAFSLVDSNNRVLNKSLFILGVLSICVTVGAVVMLGWSGEGGVPTSVPTW